MFELARLPPAPRSKNAEYHEAPWDIRNMPYKEEIIQKFIKEDLMESIKKLVDDRDIDFFV